MSAEVASKRNRDNSTFCVRAHVKHIPSSASTIDMSVSRRCSSATYRLISAKAARGGGRCRRPPGPSSPASYAVGTRRRGGVAAPPVGRLTFRGRQRSSWGRGARSRDGTIRGVTAPVLVTCAPLRRRFGGPAGHTEQACVIAARQSLLCNDARCRFIRLHLQRSGPVCVSLRLLRSSQRARARRRALTLEHCHKMVRWDNSLGG